MTDRARVCATAVLLHAHDEMFLKLYPYKLLQHPCIVPKAAAAPEVAPKDRYCAAAAEFQKHSLKCDTYKYLKKGASVHSNTSHGGSHKLNTCYSAA